MFIKDMPIWHFHFNTMNNNRLTTIPLERFKIFSSSALKLIACVSMLSDHIAKFYIYYYTRTSTTWLTATLFTIAGRDISFQQLLIMFGRFAFPIFAFLLVVGFEKTHNRKKYGISLLILALLSELPFDLMIRHHFSFYGQNVIFTLLFGYLAMCALDYFKGKPLVRLLLVVVLFLACRVVRVDYGTTGFCLILIMYGLRNQKTIQCVLGASIMPMKLMVFLSFMVIYMFNGEKGFIKTKFWKYFFYAFYPVHMLIIYFLARYCVPI